MRQFVVFTSMGGFNSWHASVNVGLGLPRAHTMRYTKAVRLADARLAAPIDNRALPYLAGVTTLASIRTLRVKKFPEPTQ